MPRAKRTNTKKKTTVKKSAKETKSKVIHDLYLPEGTFVEPDDNLLAHTMLIYGESGIGKTSMVSRIPGCYVIQCDPKRKTLRMRKTDIPNMSLQQIKEERPDVTPWEMIEGTVELCIGDDSVDVVAIDNFGMLYEHALQHRCYKQAIDDPTEENDYGATWRKIADSMTNVLNSIVEADKGLVLICHDQTKELELPDGKIDRIEPSVMKAPFKYLKENTDFAFYMSYHDSGQRVMNIRGEVDIWLKCCTDVDEPRFVDPDGNPVNRIPMGANPQQAWENLLAAWNNELHDVDHKPKRATKTSNGSTKKSRRRRVRN